MGWASDYISDLRRGEVVDFRPVGRSMEPRIFSGELCTVAPVDARHDVGEGDVVLCKVAGREFLHRVWTVKDGQFLIGNNRGRSNGWIGPDAIFGKLVKVSK